MPSLCRVLGILLLDLLRFRRLGDRQGFIIRFSTQVAIWRFFRFENVSGVSSASRRVIDVLSVKESNLDQR